MIDVTRRWLHDLARGLNEYVRQEPPKPPPAAHANGNGHGHEDRPGTDYNAKATWESILEPMHWVVAARQGDVTYWTRPGKNPQLGSSATTGYCKNEAGQDLLYVFSTSAAPFESERSYDRFGAYTWLYHNGDFSAAGKALLELGYGAGPTWKAKVGQMPRPGKGKEQEEEPSVDEYLAKGNLITWASEIEPRNVEWLWPGRIPLGKMTLFAGLGGLGKTLSLCDIAARVSRGRQWPDDAPPSPPANILYISGEDDLNDTLVPRLIACEADLPRIAFLKPEVENSFYLAAIHLLTAVIKQMGDKEVRLVVIDPPSSYLGGIDENKNAELRSILTPLKNWSAEYRLSIVFNTHLNKGGNQNKVEAMLRVMGSAAWVNAVRAAHLFTKDPDDPERRLFVSLKSNIGKERQGIAYEIEALSGELARIKWGKLVDTTAEQAMSREKFSPTAMQAAKWLAERFMERRTWRSDDLHDAADEVGITKNMMTKAKRKLGVSDPIRVTNSQGQSHYEWRVPENWTHAILNGEL